MKNNSMHSKEKNPTLSSKKIIIHYDADCMTCSWLILFLLKKDKMKQFLFSKLTPEKAKFLLKENTDTIIYEENNSLWIKAEAVQRILSTLGGGYLLISKILQLIPLGILNTFYDFFAKHRKKLNFISKKSCRILSEEEKQRFTPPSSL